MQHKAFIGITAAAAILSAGAGLDAQNQDAPKTMTGTLDPAKTRFDISPTMYGVFFEDINFAADGGLYAELIKNRSFEFPNGLSGWETDGKVEVVKGGEGDVPFPRNPHFARLTAESHRDQWTALDNGGFRGLAFEKDKTYHLTLMARLAPGTTEPVKFDAAFVREDGTMEARTPFTVNSREWKEYKVDVKAVSTQTRGKFRLLLNGHRGTVDMDHISLFPEDTWKGRANGLRNDLAQAIADLKPKIFRFPGGCIIEGTTLDQRYQWKNSVGPVGNRPLNGNRWNNTFVDHLTPDYFQSYGLGFFEFFQFCEDIGAEPLPVLNIGLACQFQNDANDLTAQVALDQLGPYIQDCLDLIEFANGPVTSTWGKVRADMGHPEPFNLKYMGIGNEQWGRLYTDRLPIFLKEIRAKHPEIKIIGSSGPNPDGADFDYLWPKMREFKADLVDEHYYRDPAWFLSHIDRYDKYDRNGPKVFAGEYACHDNPTNSLRAALCEAAFLTGIERNADVVRMTSYAPLLANYYAWQWAHDMIWFDNTTVVKTPSYLVQKLYSTNAGTHTLDLSGLGAFPADCYCGAVLDETADGNSVIVKFINLGKTAVPISINIPGAADGAEVSVAGIKGADPADKNDLANPELVKIEESKLKINGTGIFEAKQDPFSFMVYRIPVK